MLHCNNYLILPDAKVEWLNVGSYLKSRYGNIKRYKTLTH